MMRAARNRGRKLLSAIHGEQLKLLPLRATQFLIIHGYDRRNPAGFSEWQSFRPQTICYLPYKLTGRHSANLVG